MPRYLQVPRVSAERQQVVLDSVTDMSVPRPSFYLMVSLSTIIASYGLLSNSTAVVIGAMLVAPLMGPIFGIAMGLIVGDRRLLWHAVVAELLGVFLSIVLAMLLGLVPLRPEFGSEIVSRTQPTLFDLFIALAAGFAGAYALVNERISPALPGVAVATALVPPLASCGLCLAAARWDWALGAFLLFVANFLAIQLAAALVFAIAGVTAERSVPGRKHLTFARQFGLSIVALIIVGFYMSGTLTHLISDGRLTRQLQITLAREVGSTAGARLSGVRHELKDGNLQVVATVLTPYEFEPERVAGMERILRAEVAPDTRLIVRSLISKDADAKGPVFVLDQDKQHMAEAQAQAQFLSTASRVLTERIATAPGSRLIDLARDVKPGTTVVTAVVRAPSPVGPETVAKAELALRQALGVPVQLVVRSVHTLEANSSAYLADIPEASGGQPLSTATKLLRERLRSGLRNQLAATAKGSGLIGFQATDRGGRVLVLATARVPRDLEPEQVRSIEASLRKYVDPRTDLIVRSVVGTTSSANGYVADPSSIAPGLWRCDWDTRQ